MVEVGDGSDRVWQKEGVGGSSDGRNKVWLG